MPLGRGYTVGTRRDLVRVRFHQTRRALLLLRCGSGRVRFRVVGMVLRRLQEACREVERKGRRCVIPMGPLDSAGQDEVVATLNWWTRRIVRENLTAWALSERDEVPLGTYLEAIAKQPIEKHSAFHRLCDLFHFRTDQTP